MQLSDTPLSTLPLADLHDTMCEHAGQVAAYELPPLERAQLLAAAHRLPHFLDCVPLVGGWVP